MKVLNQFPDVGEFYARYWGRAPFVVRGAIDAALFDDFIDGDTLAGLALEEDIKSRIVITAPEGGDWQCEHGPFEETRFSELGETHWSLLVQNVDQYHSGTAKLLSSFHFSPRWLLDDIMISYSAAGGSVGPHTDSYHVFLVQGIGRRRWTVGDEAVASEDCIEGLDLKVLKEGVKGQAVEVTLGDVIYIPPHFAHEGVTLETAMTFSVGFLGPKISELFAEYGLYLEEFGTQNERYVGQGLIAQSSGFTIDGDAQNQVREALTGALHTDDFSKWLAAYFSAPTDRDTNIIREEPLTKEELQSRLQKGDMLYRPEHIKLTITTSADNEPVLAVYGDVVSSVAANGALINVLNQNRNLSMDEIKSCGNEDADMTLITYLYNHHVLAFEGEACEY